MDAKFRWAAILVAGLSENNVFAQATVEAISSPSDQTQSKPSADGVTDKDKSLRPPIESVDGQILPPEIQRELEEALKEKAGDLSPEEAIQKIAPEAIKRSSTGDIVVTGQRPRGSVLSDVPPEQTLSAVDIKASGATTIAELLDVLGPRLDSDRGRGNDGPIVLLNGRRVTNFLEIARIPTEAIERTEVFPEDVALSYGFSAGQKVVNIVTYENFSTQIGGLSFGGPTDGGRSTLNLTTDFLRIRGDSRINVDANYERSGNVLESERGIDQLPGAEGQGRFRSLLPKSERYSFNGAVSRPLIDDVMFTLNGRFAVVRDEALVGFGRTSALNRDSDTHTGRLATSLSGLIDKWLWTFTGGYDFNRSNTLTDSQFPARDQGLSKTETVSLDFLLNGSPFVLPAGPILASIRSGFEVRDFSSRSSIGGIVQQSSITRDQGSVRASIDVPLASQRSEILPWLGQLSINVNADVTNLSDFGKLKTFGYGLSWSPVTALSILASVTNQDGAPTVEQLAAPVVATPNANIFDFVRGETVDIIRLTGGNSRLLEDNRRVVSIAASAAPFSNTDLKFRVNYTDIRIDNPVFSFPIATQVIQDAFPERFQRDAGGRLVSIDSRAVNFKRANQGQIRWGIDFTRALDKIPPWLRNAKLRRVPVGSDPVTNTASDRIVINAAPGSALAKGVESFTSRLTFNLSHIWRLKDSIIVREGTTELNLLNGAALDQRGGRPRHEIEFQAGAFKRGIGTRIAVKWQSTTFIRGLPLNPIGGASNLRFSQPIIFNINLFANLKESTKGNVPSFLKGSRLNLSVANILNSRQNVRNDNGLTPLNYQSAFLDPLGRVISLSFRNKF